MLISKGRLVPQMSLPGKEGEEEQPNIHGCFPVSLHTCFPSAPPGFRIDTTSVVPSLLLWLLWGIMVHTWYEG